MQNLYTDSYLTGIQAAAKSSDDSISVFSKTSEYAAHGMDWSTWKPGDPGAALQVADGGLRNLLTGSDQWIRDVNSTTMDRLGNVLAVGLAQGSGPDEIARDMRGLLEDPSRAEIIATTEACRAQNAAQLEELQAQGFAQWNWLAYDGACEECMDAEGDNPYEFGDDEPPDHPNCRCSVIGATSAGEETDQPSAVEETSAELPSDVSATMIDTSGTSVEKPSETAALGGPTAPAGSNITFSSLADAKQFFSDKNVSCQVQSMLNQGFQLEHVGRLASIIEDANKKWGGIWDTLSDIKVGKSNSYLAQVSWKLGDALRHSDNIAKLTIERDTIASATNAEMKQRLFSAQDKKSLSRSWEDALHHEMGHVVQARNTKDLEVERATRAGSGIMRDAMNEAGYSNRNLIIDDVSAYASTDPMEFHAEVGIILNDPARFYALPEEAQNRILEYQRILNDKVGKAIVKQSNNHMAKMVNENIVISDNFGLTETDRIRIRQEVATSQPTAVTPGHPATT